jgi:hypothetical protein
MWVNGLRSNGGSMATLKLIFIQSLNIPYSTFNYQRLNKGGTIITPKCVLVHSGFHYILSEFEQFYHGETDQPPNEQWSVVMDNELVH